MRLSAFGKEPIDTQQHVSTVLPIMVRVRAVVRLDMHQVRAQFRQVEVEAIGMQSLDEVASLEDLEEEARLEWQSACTQRALSMHSGRISKKRLAWNGNQHALKRQSACNPCGVRHAIMRQSHAVIGCMQHALTRQWPLAAVSSAQTSYVQSSTASGPSSPAADSHATLDG